MMENLNELNIIIILLLCVIYYVAFHTTIHDKNLIMVLDSQGKFLYYTDNGQL